VDVAPALARVGDFAAYVSADDRDLDARWSAVLKAELIGRPVGAPDWVRQWEQRLGQNFSPRKRGPKPRTFTSGDPRSASLFSN
jgi:putative transposase